MEGVLAGCRGHAHRRHKCWLASAKPKIHSALEHPTPSLHATYSHTPRPRSASRRSHHDSTPPWRRSLPSRGQQQGRGPMLTSVAWCEAQRKNNGCSRSSASLAKVTPPGRLFPHQATLRARTGWLGLAEMRWSRMGSGYRQDLIEVVADQAVGKSLAARKWYVMARRSWQNKIQTQIHPAKSLRQLPS